MSTLFDMPLVLATAAFLAGYVLAKLGGLIGRREKKGAAQESDRDRRFRSMEADLRVTQRKLEEAQASVEATRAERSDLAVEVEALRTQRSANEQELEELRDQLSDECNKTQRLRSELSNRAEEGIRAQLRLRDVETELSVAQAGSEVVREEIDRLAAEREELTGRLQSLQNQLDEEEQAEGRPPLPGDLALDC